MMTIEGKKQRLSATAAWCLLAVLLLSGSGHLQPAAAMSKFCRCYKKCYAECRKDSGPFPCNFQCLQDCVNDQLPRPQRPKSAADCDRICLIRVCGVMMSTTTSMAEAGGGGDADACLVDCRNSIGHSLSAPLKDGGAN